MKTLLNSNCEISQQFKNYLKIEGQAIINLVDTIPDNNITDALQFFLNRSGMVAVIAVGKSGFVGKKFSATLNSIGILSMFIHPTEAMHGDIGALNDGDVVVLISNSGETDEIVQLLPTIKNRGSVVVGILGNHESSIGQVCHVVLNAKIETEACPLNLIPTASTTVANSICDAICVSLSQLNKMSQADFASNHPAGALGKRLNIRLRDLIFHMSAQLKVKSDLAWPELIQAIDAGKAGTLCVVNDKDELLGIITDGDIRRAIRNNKEQNLYNLVAQQVMTENPISMSEMEFAYDALTIMENRKSEISSIVISDEKNQYKGLVRLHDILKTGLKI